MMSQKVVFWYAKQRCEFLSFVVALVLDICGKSDSIDIFWCLLNFLTY
jgi:hypothetical protein